MKKTIALLLALSLLLACASSALAEKDISEHFDYSATYIGAGTGAVEDDMYRYFCDMFNIDFEMIGYDWADYASAASLAINGGTMQDLVTVDTGFSMISEWADQGLIKALPDNWQEAYPNIYNYIKNSSLLSVVTEADGKVYCIPKAIYYHFTTGDTYLWHFTLYYRADWAKELGYTFGDTVTLSELCSFIRDCQAKDMAGNGNTVGLTLRSGMLQELMRLGQPYFGTFTKVNGQYVWGPTMDNTVETIVALKQLYNEGILDPDFYINGNGAEMALFTTGQAAAMIYDGLVGSYGGLINDMVASGVAADTDEALEKTALTVLVNDEGAWRGSETANYCWANVFNPDMPEDKFLRLLDLMDYLYSKEGELVYNMGIRDVAWYETEDGYKKIYYNAEGDMATADFDKNLYALAKAEDGSFVAGEIVGKTTDADNTYQTISYPSQAFWFRQAILGDDFMLVDPGANPNYISRISRCYAARYENAMKNGYCALDFDYTFFNSTAKNEYSVDIAGEILRLIAGRDIPVENVAAEWNAFIENNRVAWEPVINDLNAAFAK